MWREDNIKQEKVEENDGESIGDKVEEESTIVQKEPDKGVYITRSGRVSRPPVHLVETAYAV